MGRFGDDSGSQKWTSDIKERGDIKYLEARGLRSDRGRKPSGVKKLRFGGSKSDFSQKVF